jgi:hypothetical protein
LAAGTLSGVVLIALFAAAPYLGWSGDPQQLRAVFWVGGILTSFAASVEYMHTFTVFAGDFQLTRQSLMYLLLMLCMLACGIVQTLNVSADGWPLLLAASIPALLTAILCEIRKKLRSLSEKDHNDKKTA